MDDDRHAWENPGAHEVAPGVWRIPLPLPNDGLKAVNVYAIADGDQLVMIDGGWALDEAPGLLDNALNTIDRELRDIREFLVTHIHRDHYTLAVALRRVYGQSVSLGEGERVSMEALRTVEVHPEIANLYSAGASDLAKQLAEFRGDRDISAYEDPDRWLTDGLDLPLQSRTLRVIATPGHTRGHVVFHDVATNVLFAGDHILPHITPSIGTEIVRTPSPLRDYMASLQLIRALPDAKLFPAHGPVAPSVHDRVDALLAHHEQRLVTMHDAVVAGHSTGYDVARAVPWTRHGRRLDELDMFNQLLAVQETVAHLTVLVEADELSSTSVDGVVHYAAR